MRSTLLAAQKMAASMVEDAKAEREKILSSARDEAATQVTNLEQQTQQAKEKLVLAQQKLAEFVAHSQQLCAQQAEFLQQLPETDISLLKQAEPATQPEPQENVLTQDTVRLIERDILQNFQQPRQEPAEEEPVQPVAEESAQPTEAPQEPEEVPVQPVEEKPAEDMDFTSDFKLNLEELKFGRNYTGEK